jgi:thymidylate kinase
MSLFVTVDGIDGVGKTTAAKLLAEECGMQYYKSPSGPFTALRKDVDEEGTALGRYCFYRLVVAHDSCEIQKLLKRGPVVADRYVKSTLAYHLVLDPRIQDIHNEDGLLKPHLEILLSARADVRIKRMQERRKRDGLVATDIKLEDNVRVLNDVGRVFQRLGMTEVDTSDLSPSEVVAKLKILINGGCCVT